MTHTPQWLAEVQIRNDLDRRMAREGSAPRVWTQAMEDRRALLQYIETLQAEAVQLIARSLEDSQS